MRQWRTANQRVVLDLYDRRMKAFDEIELAIFAVQREAEVTMETLHQFAQGQLDARFVFGDEITAYIQELRGAFAYVQAFHPLPQGSIPYDAADIKIKHQHILRILAFHNEGVPKFRPYLDLTTKNLSFWHPW